MHRTLTFPLRSYLIGLTLSLTGVGLLSEPLPVAAQTTAANTNTAVSFLSEVSARYPAAASISSLTLSGNATWVVGGAREEGPATIEATSNGASTLKLNLDKASRLEAYTALGDTRACQWTDSNGTHELNGVDCAVPLSWFVPTFALQPASSVMQLLNVVDDGNVSRDSSAFRQITFRSPFEGDSSPLKNIWMKGASVSVLYATDSLLPSSFEYLQHADDDLNVTFPVRIVYSNYQTVSGIPIPYQIDRYVNGALQLSLTITSASFK